MRFNCHTHIFTFRSVFTRETISTLVRRLSREKWPDFVTKAAEKILRKHLSGERLDEEALLGELVGALKADKALQKLLTSGTAPLPPSVTLALEGDIKDLPVGALREIIGKLTGALQSIDDEDAPRADLGDFVAFFALGIKPSIEAVAAKLIEYSGPDTAVVTLMMDITAGGGADDELFRGQLEDTARAALVFPGRVLPFVAVNPKRTLHFERMTFALEERGFVGVKLYPSLGYAIDTPEMRRVYAYCAEHDTPLLLHCNRGGFFRDEPSIEFCDPEAWRPVLRDWPNLRVCFGHFGGDENLITPTIDPDSWTGRIMDLMRKFPRVYADISYHDDPMDGGENETNYFNNLAGLLDDADIGSRILFGSDFHLVRQRLRDDNLWRFFENRFSGPHFKLIAKTNPAAYLGMPAATGLGAAANITRHLRYLARHNFEVREQPAPWAATAINAVLGEIKFFPNEFGSDWTSNNEAHFYTDQFFRDLMNSADAQRLTFAEAGRLRMRDLDRYPSQALPDTVRQPALRQIATGLQAFITQSPQPAAILETGTTSAQARAALVGLLENPDSRLAAFGPAVDRLYRFNSEPAQP